MRMAYFSSSHISLLGDIKVLIMRVVGRQMINILNIKLDNGKLDKEKIKLGQGLKGQKLFQVE